MKFRLGFVQLVSGRDDDGKEYLRLEWSSAWSNPAIEEQRRTAMEHATGAPARLCSDCIWCQPDMFWASRGMDGQIIIRDPKAWRHAKCMHPTVRRDVNHLTGPGVMSEGEYVTLLRSPERGQCGEEGKLFEAAVRPTWRHPRRVLPWVLSVLPAAVLGVVVASSADHALRVAAVFLLPAAGMMGWGLWNLGRRI